MSKIRKKKQLLSAATESKKKNGKKNTLHVNPFEVHIDKEKMKLLGKKDLYGKSIPGVSRAKAIEKRKTTILHDYNQLNKTNRFNDKRIGELNYDMTPEDKNILRFTAVRLKAHNKKSFFNLAGTETLTHQGETLSEMERFEDPQSDNEDWDEDGGKLNNRFVNDAHFGGGLLKKSNNEGLPSHKDLIEELISESKKRKVEQQKIKQSTLELTEKLDSVWEDLSPFIGQVKGVSIPNNCFEDYDKVRQELKFVPCGIVSDRLKSENEIAQEENEKLLKLEQERILRMTGVSVSKDKHLQTCHRSADDLDDEFIYEEIEEKHLSYNKDGQLNISFYCNSIPNNLEVLEEIENELNVKDSPFEDTESEEDSLSDLKNNTSYDEIKGDKTMADNKSVLLDIQVKHNKNSFDSGKNSLPNAIIFQRFTDEIPYTFGFPESYESLQHLLENKLSTQQSIIIERIMKCHHQSLSGGNKNKLELLFAYLLQYLNDRFVEFVNNESSLKESFQILEALIPCIYELAQINPTNTQHSLLEIIKEKYGDYIKQPKKYPGLELLVFLKLVCILLPTSDFKHPVVSPCFVLIEELLARCKVKSKRDISYGMFLTTLILEVCIL